MNRETKLAIERKRRQEEELQECSFAPNLGHDGHSKTKKIGGNFEGKKEIQINRRLGSLKFEEYDSNPVLYQGAANGSFSYDTPFAPYLDFPNTCLENPYSEDTQSVRRLDFGEDPEVYDTEIQAHMPLSSNISHLSVKSPPPPSTGYNMVYPAESSDDGVCYDDYDEYGAEFELDETGQVISGGRY